MRVIEFLLIGSLVVMMLASGWAMGRKYCYEPETAASMNHTVPDRDLNMPLVPEGPDKGLGYRSTRTRF